MKSNGNGKTRVVKGELDLGPSPRFDSHDEVNQIISNAKEEISASKAELAASDEHCLQIIREESQTLAQMLGEAGKVIWGKDCVVEIEEEISIIHKD